MPVIAQLDPPGGVKDLAKLPALRQRRSALVSQWFDAAIERIRPLAPKPQFYNPLVTPTDPGSAEQEITWLGFPQVLRREANGNRGISQPGVRGRASRRRDDYITARQVDPDDPASRLWSHPGQPLVWPGQFVFGYVEQDPRDPLVPGRTAVRGPVWAKNGSFVVVRRLQQDVAGFWRCVHRHASGLRKQNRSSAWVRSR